ncbi:MAG: hypothetical protein V1928_02775 [Parcubacteria group bacterium]
MIFMVKVNAEQLEAIHKVLNEEGNFWMDEIQHDPNEWLPVRRAYVYIKNVAGAGTRGEPLPSYEVTLEAGEEYAKSLSPRSMAKTPIERLRDVFKVIDLFPSEKA